MYFWSCHKAELRVSAGGLVGTQLASMGASGAAGIAAAVAGFPRLAWECHRALAAAASVGRCRLTVSRSLLKAPVVSALETMMS
jgi:hypothetical protein